MKSNGIASNAHSIRNAHSGWSIFTNHGHVILCLAQSPDTPLRDVALRVGITERAVQRIVADLEAAGFITRSREGRTNHYDILSETHLRHPVEAHCSIGQIIDMVASKDASPPQG